MEYKERLEYLELPCLAYRRIRGDAIEVYKMMNEKYDQEIEVPIVQANKIHHRDNRNAQYSLHKSKIKTTARKLSFKNRVVHFWNELPTKVKEAPSILSFEKRLDRYWREYGIIYDYDKCLDFEKQRLDPNYAGTGPRNIKTDLNLDMELQAI